MPDPFNQVLQTRHGPTITNRNDQFIGRSLAFYGEWSEGEVDVLLPLLTTGQTVVELGANIGAHTLPLARAVDPTGRVVAVEPQRLVFQALCGTVALNSLTNVETLHAAAGESSGSVVVPAIDPSRPNNFGGIELGRTPIGETVPVITVDSLKLPACHLIKADVEGMEEAALRGASETIRRCRPLLYVECDREDRTPSLLHCIDSLGYDIYQHWVPLFRPDNFRRNPTNHFPNIVSKNLLAIPREHPREVNLPRIVIQHAPNSAFGN